jgi:enoyl-CoA hydratase/carnithine racemase
MENAVQPTIDVKAGPGFQTWSMALAPVNALNPASLKALKECLAAAEADPSVAAIVLTSGLKIFSAGGDASWMGQLLKERGPDGLVDQFNETMDTFREVCVALHRSPLLIIAALNGHTLAGGLELAAACDLRFVADSDRLQIGVPEMDLFGAMPSGGGGAQFIARLMGPTRALQFILNAKPIGPKAAFEAGLVDRLCEPATLLEQAEGFAQDVARKAGRIGVAAAKRAIFGGAELPLMSAMDLDRSVHWDNMRRGNFRAGATDFVKRFG